MTGGERSWVSTAQPSGKWAQRTSGRVGAVAGPAAPTDTERRGDQMAADVPAEPFVVESDCQCARCGSSAGSDGCGRCEACGYWDKADPTCPFCKGTGTVWFCLSGADWCEAHPNPGREHVQQGTVEWFDIFSDGTTRIIDR